MVDKSECKHEQFGAKVEVNRLENIGAFMADVTVTCLDCGTPFQFVGLPGGLQIGGATCSVDMTEARLTIRPFTYDEAPEKEAVNIEQAPPETPSQIKKRAAKALIDAAAPAFDFVIALGELIQATEGEEQEQRRRDLHLDIYDKVKPSPATVDRSMIGFMTGLGPNPMRLHRLYAPDGVIYTDLTDAKATYSVTQGETANVPGQQVNFTHTIDTAATTANAPILSDPGPALSPLALPRNSRQKPGTLAEAHEERERMKAFRQSLEQGAKATEGENRTFDQEWEKWRPGDLIVWEDDKQGPMYPIVRINLATGYAWWDDPAGGPENMTRCTNLLRVTMHSGAGEQEARHAQWIKDGLAMEGIDKGLQWAKEALEANWEEVTGKSLSRILGGQVNEFVADEWLKRQGQAPASSPDEEKEQAE